MSNLNKVLGYERINERRQRPNKLINFIKPLEGADKDLAQDFLERVAALCYPIMKANNIVVMSLEEYPPNKEFWGRNFNAGEVIQLVLKAPNTGQWLPFRHVQMVMMHELAHCKEMNHSRAFWKVNNAYRDGLKELWTKGYTGEGLWGRGQTLLSGRYTIDHMPDATTLPENLCGGTYRSRGGRKRKRADSDKPKLSYAERQQRRIAKKFGVNGQQLGADELARFGLDQGRHRPSKPRIANSKRGRELRVAAALARFDKAKQKPSEPDSATASEEEDYESDSETEELERTANPEWDHNDSMIRVCENEDPEDDDAQREMDELIQIDRPPAPEEKSSKDKKRVSKKSRAAELDYDEPAVATGVDNQTPAVKDEEDESHHYSANNHEARQETTTAAQEFGSNPHDTDHIAKPRTAPTTTTAPPARKKPDSTPKDPPPTSPTTMPTTTNPSPASASSNPNPSPLHPPQPTQPALTPPIPTPASPSNPPASCQICSFSNDPGAASCTVCAHVIDTDKIPGWWRCRGAACRGSAYRNLGDYGRCAVCGLAKGDGAGT